MTGLQPGIGVDGCKAGWFWVLLTDTDASFGVAREFREILESAHLADRIVVDIPIGLPRGSEYPRECDKRARQLLGSPRGRSVFNVPSRDALEAPDFDTAKEVSRRVSKVAFSIQLWALRPKILEVDRALRGNSSARTRVRETHPELAFWALNDGVPFVEPKRTLEGFERRFSLLNRYDSRAETLIREALDRFPRSAVARDDVVDAFACALVSRSPAVTTIPSEPPADEHGLRMEMCLPDGLPVAGPFPARALASEPNAIPSVASTTRRSRQRPRRHAHGDIFARDLVLSLDAAIVGIGRVRWCAIDEEQASEEAARAVMREHRYDVLPIEPERGPVREFFTTVRWNDYSRIQRRKITFGDVLAADTPIRDVIRELAESGRTFFFLTSGRGVDGLVSVVNLNCRQVRVYLFSLLSEFERELGAVVKSRDRTGLVEKALRKSKGWWRNFESDLAHGVDASAIEYLGLRELLNVANTMGLIEELDLATPSRLDFDELRVLRNRVAHPIKSVVPSEGSVTSLWRWISLLEEMIFGLRQLNDTSD